MARFDDLRADYKSWDEKYRRWRELGRDLPPRFLGYFARYLDAPNTAAFGGGKYVDLFSPLPEGAPSAQYKAVSRHEAAIELPTRRWQFVIGVTIDEPPGSSNTLHLFLKIDFWGGDGDKIELAMPDDTRFTVELGDERSFSPAFDNIIAGLRKYLRSPYPPEGGGTLGFSIG